VDRSASYFFVFLHKLFISSMFCIKKILSMIEVRGCIAWAPKPEPQADGPKLPMVCCCATQFHHELGQKSSFSTMDTMEIFRIITPKCNKLTRGSYLTKLSVCFPYSPLFDGKVISNSDDQIFTVRRVCIAWTMPWQDVCPSVRPSVRHTPVLSVNGYTYTQNFFIVG